MSLTEMIFGNQLVLLSLVLALSPLVLALAFLMIARLRKRRVQRAQAALAAAVVAAAEAEAAAAAPPESLAQTAAFAASQAQKGVAHTTAPATPAAAKPSLLAAKPPDTPAQPEQKPGEAAEGGAIESLLSDVFADEQTSNRAATLLKDRQPVPIDDLLALTAEVADKLAGARR